MGHVGARHQRQRKQQQVAWCYSLVSPADPQTKRYSKQQGGKPTVGRSVYVRSIDADKGASQAPTWGCASRVHPVVRLRVVEKGSNAS